MKQKYNTTSDSFVNYYYFWVRNSVFLPPKDKSVTERKNTTAYVANLIENPLGSGIKYYAITGTNSLITFNVKNSLTNNNTVLNVNYKNNDNNDTAHSVWKLIREGDKDDRPNALLEKKWWDSLVGKDSSGNEVPDITLPINQRYGNGIRPRQSWYVNRFAALKEIVDYSNSVLTTKELSNNISYTNLNSADPEPTAASGAVSYTHLTLPTNREV